jgi:hypothetical protein
MASRRDRPAGRRIDGRGGGERLGQFAEPAAKASVRLFSKRWNKTVAVWTGHANRLGIFAANTGMTAKRKAGKKMDVDTAKAPKSKRRRKLIRLDDLIPKKDVVGGRQVLFGARDSGNGGSTDGSTGR